MYKRDKKIHFVGIGGVGMAGIAELVARLGYPVSGSDQKRSKLTTHLESELAIPIAYQHSADNLSADVGVLVRSSAIPEHNEELVAAKARGIPVIPRAEMLAELMRMKYGIAVAGSHGKTTTTSLIAHLLERCGLHPSVVVGGRVLSRESGAVCGNGQFLVAEADESDGSFCLLRPVLSVVTNLDAEHLDHFGSFEELRAAFLSFMNSVPFYGVTVYCADDPELRELGRQCSRRTLSYGFSKHAELSVSQVKFFEEGSEFTVSLLGTRLGEVRIPLFGDHMVLNAVAAIAIGLEVGVTFDALKEAIQDYPGVARRLELKGVHAGVEVFDDYGHHPTEIRCTLRTLRAVALKSERARLHVIFEPHRYSRVEELFRDFAECFYDADVVYVTDIYAAGEAPRSAIHSEQLARAIEGPSVEYVGSLENAAERVVASVRADDVVVALGAGAVSHACDDVLEGLANKLVAVAR